jgi:5-methylcytosine-specific restriction protein A
MTEAQEFFTASEAPRFLRYSPATMAIWRSQGRGPAYMKIGHSVRYRRDDFTAWAMRGDTARQQIEELAACHRSQRARVKRPRGRAGAAQRQRRLSAEPNCRDCAAEGLTRAAVAIDHIIPLALGGQDTDEDVRALCRGCHELRTRKLRESHSAGKNASTPPAY